MNYNEKNMQIYDMYLESNKARNFETINTTYKMYKSRMIDYLSYLKEKEGNKLLLSEATIKSCVNILERYINHCRDKGNNNQTINNKLTAISSFYIWCVKRDLIKYHPFQHKLDRLRNGRFDKRRESYYLSIEDIMRAKILMEHNSKKFDIQSRLMWELFLESAARISAISNLKLSQLDLKGGYFKNVKEKGNKIVDIIFLDNTEKLLREWLNERENKGIISDLLFITKRNGEIVQMQQSTIRARIKKIGELIGYEQLYPHTLRKTAINLLSNLSDINFASEYANHSDTKVTKEYYIKTKSGAENRDKILQIRRSKGL
ncbi:tyrosine-type recombinase/integrase [Cetobacterium sp. 2A]|uniref:tyrosine-type recombinase/integrase n=1 Tax=Cetobacterium sp. 2A TaxID=2754723 RepID=UPI00163C192B|nr:tyrosine-type recombinase/integrase [Cetobacterium sp. 2A]MBC2855229.1 tyrosine-type recombinase/integrase [Cetobacterium sp. 2A]MBC2855278.1 tyrosine-type recombinase/integrase [Cetobacterium sp. 2A]MBC2855636.1 tyrosine-type recombinase/integrase [Cetobacterium sp. 2A]